MHIFRPVWPSHDRELSDLVSCYTCFHRNGCHRENPGCLTLLMKHELTFTQVDTVVVASWCQFCKNPPWIGTTYLDLGVERFFFFRLSHPFGRSVSLQLTFPPHVWRSESVCHELGVYVWSLLQYCYEKLTKKGKKEQCLWPLQSSACSSCEMMCAMFIWNPSCHWGSGLISSLI